MNAWWFCTMRTPMTTWPLSLFSTLSERERALFHFILCVSTLHFAHTQRGSSNESFIPSTCPCSCERLALFSLSTSRTSCRIPSTFLSHLKFVVNLHTPLNESMHLSDEFLFSTGCEPNANDFKEISVEPYTELLDSPPLFSDKVSSADADYDDPALEGMLCEVHRVHSHHSPREDLFVSLLPSAVSDRTGQPVGDRTGDPLSKETRKHRLGLCSTNKKSKFLQSAKQEELTDTNFKPLTTEEAYWNRVKLLNPNKKNFALELKKFQNEINSFFKDNFCSKIWNYAKFAKEVSLKWKT